VRRFALLTATALLTVACRADAQNPRTVAPSDAPSQPRTVATVAPLTFDSAKAWTHLEKQVAFGPRPAGSPALAQCRQYIEAQLKSLGIAFRDQTFDAMTPAGVIRMVNVIGTIPGRRPERIALATHYDTKRFQEFRFLGASDAASSTAAVLELARILKGRQNEFTIELLFLDGEEARMPDWHGTDNTYGSRHYVEVARRDGSITMLKALVLIDMIGDRDLDIRRDTNSTPWLTNIIWEAAKRQDLDDYFVADSTRIEDDHLPFLAAGVPSVDIIDLDYEAWHTAKDSLDAVSARSLQVVGDVVLGALPTIEAHLSKSLVLTGRRVVSRRPYKVLKANAVVPSRKRFRQPMFKNKHLRQSSVTALTELGH